MVTIPLLIFLAGLATVGGAAQECLSRAVIRVSYDLIFTSLSSVINISMTYVLDS